jgi:hypothetical protein
MSLKGLPTLTNEQRAAVEAKLVAAAISKVNSGQAPSKLEMEAIDAAHARGQHEETPPPFFVLPTVTTELGFETVVTETLESRGIYDLSRLEARKPELAKAAVKMLAKGLGVDEIAECLSLDVRTIAALRDKAEESGAMPGHKEMTVRRLKTLLGMMISKYEQGLSNGTIKPGALDLAVIIDKIEVLTGGVTNRVEVVVTNESDDFTRLIAQERQARVRMVTATEEISSNASRPALPPPDSNAGSELLNPTRDNESPEFEPV